jgi:hypothetical protein
VTVFDSQGVPAYLLQNLGDGSFVDFDELLELVEVIVKLLEPLDESDEICGDTGIGIESNLNYSLLVEQSLEAEGELWML